MTKRQHEDQTALSIERRLSVRRLRSLNPQGPIAELSIRSDRVFSEKLAREVSSWISVRQILIWGAITKAALRQLLSTPDLEQIYVLRLLSHGSLGGMPCPASLHTFRCGSISCDDLLHLAELPNLETLSAQDSQVSGAAIEKLSALTSLANLDLEASNLDDEMAQILASSKTIVQLDMGATRVGQKGLQSICEMTQLRELDIWALDIGESDLDMLTALPNLEYLSVGGYEEQTVLTAKGVLPRLARLPSLKRLWLDGIPLNKDQIARLQERYDHVQTTSVQ